MVDQPLTSRHLSEELWCFLIDFILVFHDMWQHCFRNAVETLQSAARFPKVRYSRGTSPFVVGVQALGLHSCFIFYDLAVVVAFYWFIGCLENLATRNKFFTRLNTAGVSSFTSKEIGVEFIFLLVFMLLKLIF